MEELEATRKEQQIFTMAKKKKEKTNREEVTFLGLRYMEVAFIVALIIIIWRSL